MIRLLKVLPHGSGAILVSVVGVDLIADLSAGLATAKLATELEARIPINADLSAINGLKVKTVHGIFSLLSGGILNKAETAGSLLHLVQTHNQVDYLATLTKELE
jgi:hypothetical protein